MKSALYVNNLTSSIANTNYKILMPTHHVYSTIYPVCLTLFRNRESPFLFANISFFLDKGFCFIVLTV